MGLGQWLFGDFKATRHTDGSIFYEIGHQKHSFDGYTNLDVALKNPLLFGLIDKIASSLAQTEFYIGDLDNPTPDPLTDLINNPNDYQSKEDFWREYVFLRISDGFVFQAPIGAEGFEDKIDSVDSIYNLNTKHITYDNTTFQTKLLTRKQIQERQVKFRYKIDNNVNRAFDVSQIIPFFDVANGVCEDFLLRSPSKLDSVLMPAVNMLKAFEAQNIIIKSNGREMFFSEKKTKELGIAKPIGSDDKQEIQRKNAQYGMQRGQNRSMFLNGETGWKSLHIPMKDLGFQEVMETTAGAIAAALNIPRSLLPIFDNPKYENQKEAEISLIQTITEPMAADICGSYSSYFGYEGDKKLKYSVDHLAPMQHIEQIKVRKFLDVSTAYRNLQTAGFTPDQSQELAQSMGVTFGDDE
ncbi:hypothetical protein AAU57_12000 [Nonlabens sp. YIK11]|uniref:phage portal protein n=1 Tax=Nonlabens sp. YIK11 TaxID=1453349 RepID=UPI0006DCCC40|nr:phage portal protein [Nonlabens sp. YIK11]KQC33971.1 hypothetical protein AAU57_12000 [Nonlabens sp. YIK11]